jgi:hypothetical protein
MRFVLGSEHQSPIAARMFPRDTPERFAAEKRLLDHPHQKALLMGLVWGFAMWLTALRHDTRAWAILLTIAVSLCFGYSVVLWVRCRHRRSRYRVRPS